MAEPMIFDPVEQRTYTTRLSRSARFKESIFAWVDAEEGSREERVAWDRLRHAAIAWLHKGGPRP